MDEAMCAFCEIVGGRAEASVVEADERCVAFMDLFPATPGHVLIAPRAHASSLAELSIEDGAALIPMAKRVASALRRSGVRCEGVTLLLADGEAAGQEVRHVHLHVIPRFVGDGVRIVDVPAHPSRAELDEKAVALRTALPL